MTPPASAHPYLAIAHLNREGRQVVGPEVKCAAAFVVEAGVGPVTGQDAILMAPRKHEIHVWHIHEHTFPSSTLFGPLDRSLLLSLKPQDGSLAIVHAGDA